MPTSRGFCYSPDTNATPRRCALRSERRGFSYLSEGTYAAPKTAVEVDVALRRPTILRSRFVLKFWWGKWESKSTS